MCGKKTSSLRWRNILNCTNKQPRLLHDKDFLWCTPPTKMRWDWTLQNCWLFFEWILLSIINCANRPRLHGCLCINLGIWDKRQIQNETKTIYCILLIIFCEESWGEEEWRTSTKRQQQISHRLYEFYLLCLFATESSSSFLAHSVFIFLLRLLTESKITRCKSKNKNSFSFCVIAHMNSSDEKFKINRMMNNSHPHNCFCKRSACAEISIYVPDPSLIDDPDLS